MEGTHLTTRGGKIYIFNLSLQSFQRSYSSNRNDILTLFPTALPASRFMAYHIPLTNSQEFTAALMKARELAHNITIEMRKTPGTSPDFEVFPYTYVHLFPIFLHLQKLASAALNIAGVFFLPIFQGDKCVLWAVPDYCARGTFQHLLVSAAHLRGVLPAAGLGPALRAAQPNDHNYDHRGYCWHHDTVGHSLQRSGPYQSGYGKKMMCG